MKHLSNAELIATLGTLHAELARRFGPNAPAPQYAPAPSQPTAAPASAPRAPRLDPPELDLLQDAISHQYFYSVCGQAAQCGCRYNIIPATRWAEGDMKQRPAIDMRVLYLYGLDTKQATSEQSEAELRKLVAKYKPESIKVVRTYAFLTFASHAATAAAQRLLTTKGYVVTFNRIQTEEEQRASHAERKEERRKKWREGKNRERERE